MKKCFFIFSLQQLMVPALLYIIPNVDIPYFQKIQSGLQTVNRTVQSVYFPRNNSAPFRVLQVVNVNVLPLRKQSEFPKERDVESVEDNYIPQVDNEGQTQVDVFFNPDGKYVPPQRIRGGIRDYSYSVNRSKYILQSNENKKLFLPFTKYDTSPVTDTYVDKLVDFVILIVNKDIREMKLDEFDIPHVHKDFTNKIGFIEVSGSFDATGGTFRNLSTIYRTEPVTVSRVGDSLIVDLGLGLYVMNFDFRHYDMKWSELGAEGTLKGKCSSDSINVRLTISLNETHCIKLNSLKVDKLGDIEVEVTGLGPLSWMLSKVVSWISDEFKSEIIKVVEHQLANAVEATLGKLKCSREEYLHFSMN